MLQVNFTPFPVLTTERLVLRPPETDDVNEIFFLRSDPRVMKYIGREPCRSAEEAVEHIEMLAGRTAENVGITWAITLKGDDRLIGTIAHWRMEKENYRAEIGYVLHPDHQGKGIMHEAMGAVIAYGFNVMGLHSIEANTHTENAASQNVLLKNGFVQEAYFRENYYYKGRFLDSAVFSLVSPVPWMGPGAE